jgi:hypothetical protein
MPFEKVFKDSVSFAYTLTVQKEIKIKTQHFYYQCLQIVACSPHISTKSERKTQQTKISDSNKIIVHLICDSNHIFRKSYGTVILVFGLYIKLQLQIK